MKKEPHLTVFIKAKGSMKEIQMLRKALKTGVISDELVKIRNSSIVISKEDDYQLTRSSTLPPEMASLGTISDIEESKGEVVPEAGKEQKDDFNYLEDFEIIEESKMGVATLQGLPKPNIPAQ